MYAGQGSQYFQMGRELFETNSSFQAAMRRCDREALAISDNSLISVLYGNTPNSEPFVNIRQTGAALYSIGYALTETMIAEGFEPDGVLGHSMGEYIAAAVAGAMDWREGLSVVLRQAALLEPLSGKGGLLSVLASPDLFLQDKQTFAHLTLAGVNYEGNFVVSGESAALDAAHSRLDSIGHVALRLPVPIAFHADQVDVVKNDFLAIRIAARSPSLPIYSSAQGRRLEGASLDNPGQYFWEVIRGRIKFEEVMNSAFSDQGDYYFVDLSATGSFANFLKYGYNRRYRCKSAINQFGNNRASLKSLTSELAALC
jgi:acyl transferase domain-containing protein